MHSPILMQMLWSNICFYEYLVRFASDRASYWVYAEKWELIAIHGQQWNSRILRTLAEFDYSILFIISSSAHIECIVLVTFVLVCFNQTCRNTTVHLPFRDSEGLAFYMYK